MRRKQKSEAQRKTRSVLFPDDGCDVDIKAAAAFYKKAKNARKMRRESVLKINNGDISCVVRSVA
jgi:hypothetical protein